MLYYAAQSKHKTMPISKLKARVSVNSHFRTHELIFLFYWYVKFKKLCQFTIKKYQGASIETRDPLIKRISLFLEPMMLICRIAFRNY